MTKTVSALVAAGKSQIDQMGLNERVAETGIILNAEKYSMTYTQQKHR